MELITLAQERYSQLSNEIEGKSLARQESVTIEDICRYPLAGFGGELYPPEIAVALKADEPILVSEPLSANVTLAKL